MYVFAERYGKVSYFASGEGVKFQFIFAGILPMQPGSWLGQHSSTVGDIEECLPGPESEKRRRTEKSSTVLYFHPTGRPHKMSKLFQLSCCVSIWIQIISETKSWKMDWCFLFPFCKCLFFEIGSLRGIPSGEDLEMDEQIPARLRQDENQLDVFAMVRQYMSDGFLQQNPILVLPESLAGESRHFLANANSAPTIGPWLSPERKEEIKLLADELAEDFPHMQRAVGFYRSLLQEDRALQPYEQIRFLRNVARCGQRWCQFNLGDRAPRPKPHVLQVVFHRNRGHGWTKSCSAGFGFQQDVEKLGDIQHCKGWQRCDLSKVFSWSCRVLHDNEKCLWFLARNLNLGSFILGPRWPKARLKTTTSSRKRNTYNRYNRC